MLLTVGLLLAFGIKTIVAFEGFMTEITFVTETIFSVTTRRHSVVRTLGAVGVESKGFRTVLAIASETGT